MENAKGGVIKAGDPRLEGVMSIADYQQEISVLRVEHRRLKAELDNAKKYIAQLKKV